MSGSMSASIISWLNLVPLTAQEWPEKMVSEYEVHNEERGRMG